MRNKQLTGERINQFENCLTFDVKTFNMIFTDYPLDLAADTEIEIGEIQKVNCYEIINLSSGEKFDHYFERRKLDESISDDNFDDEHFS